jgi:hypothetical protein
LIPQEIINQLLLFLIPLILNNQIQSLLNHHTQNLLAHTLILLLVHTQCLALSPTQFQDQVHIQFLPPVVIIHNQHQFHLQLLFLTQAQAAQLLTQAQVAQLLTHLILHLVLVPTLIPDHKIILIITDLTNVDIKVDKNTTKAAINPEIMKITDTTVKIDKIETK